MDLNAVVAVLCSKDRELAWVSLGEALFVVSP